MSETVRLKVKRQDEPGAAPRWEEFEVPWEERLNVHAALMAIQRNPKTQSGQKTTPVVWDANCLEEVCGSCTMVINGRVRQSCSALVDQLSPEGTTVTGTPASAHAITSSYPRANTNGSPPLSRTTKLPARARSIMTSLMASCAMERP